MENISEGNSTARKSYACHICYRTFNRLPRLQMHIRTHNKPSILVSKSLRKTSEESNEEDEFLISPTPAEEKLENEIVFEIDVSEVEIPSEDKQQKTSNDKSKLAHNCKVCSMTFPSRCQLMRHQVTHTEAKPYICTVCGRAFATIGNLSVHSRSHSPNRKSRKIPKDDPDDPYPTKSSPKKKESYQCDVCKKLFKNKCYLDRHALSHSKERPYVCEVCYKGFTQVGNLNVHYKTHSKEKNCICYLCNKAFTHISSLKVHMVTHSEEKPHKCNVCNRGFANPCFLKRHLLIHTKSKPYVCNVCQKGFAQLGNLNVHKLTHSKPKMFECDFCKVTFVSKGCYEKHCTQHVMEDILRKVVVSVDGPGSDATKMQLRDRSFNTIKNPSSSSVAMETKEVKNCDYSLLTTRAKFRQKARKSIIIKSIFSLNTTQKQYSS